jgi:hypothetical protein
MSWHTPKEASITWPPISAKIPSRSYSPKLPPETEELHSSSKYHCLARSLRLQ